MIGMRSEMSPDPRFPKQDGTFDQLIPGSVREYGYYIIQEQQSHQVTTLKGNATYIECPTFLRIMFFWGEGKQQSSIN